MTELEHGGNGCILLAGAGGNPAQQETLSLSWCDSPGSLRALIGEELL
jgi:hypothetical protein